MRVIYKYPVIGFCTLEIPVGAKFLDVQLQNGLAHIWVECDPTERTEARSFMVMATGQELKHDGTYLGTWQEPPFVWHLYEVTP